MRNTVETMLSFYAQIRRVYVNEFTQRFQEKKFSPNELDLMLFLSNNPSINTSSQLCTCLNVSKALICRSVDSLTAGGFLTSVPDRQDRRVQHLFLTESAAPIIEKIRSIRTELDQEILSGIPKESLEQMEQTMQKILERFQQKEKGE